MYVCCIEPFADMFCCVHSITPCQMPHKQARLISLLGCVRHSLSASRAREMSRTSDSNGASRQYSGCSAGTGYIDGNWL